MNKILVVLIIVLLSACASKKEETRTVVVTGERISRAELEASGVELVSVGTVDDFIKDATAGMDLPIIKNGMRRQEVREQLEQKSFVILSENEEMILAMSSKEKFKNVTITYKFINGRYYETTTNIDFKK